MSGFDINQQAEKAKKEDEGTEVHIHGLDDLPMFYEEDGEQKPVTITVAGAHSQTYRRIEDSMRRRKLKPKQLTGEAIFSDNIEKAAACTLDWQGFFVGEEVVQPTANNIKQLYKTCPWVYEQVFEAMHDHARFFGNGSTQQLSSSDFNLD